MPRKTQILPLPELLPGHADSDWQVEETPPQLLAQGALGATDLKDLKMAAPTADDGLARFTRNHEMMHVRITDPTRTPAEVAAQETLDVGMFQACEDARVHNYMKQAGLLREQLNPEDGGHNLYTGAELDSMIAQLDKLPNIEAKCAAVAYPFCQTQNMADFDQLWQRLPQDIKAKMGPVWDYLARLRNMPQPTQRDAIEAARNISSYLDLLAQSERNQREAEEAAQEAAEEAERIMRQGNGADRQQTKTLAESTREIAERNAHRERAARRQQLGPADPNDNSGWGKMQKVTLPLTDPLPPQLRGSKQGAVRTGGQLRYVRNLYRSEPRLFRRTKASKGGTVLMDLSGSMSLSQDQIYSMLAACGGVTVAGYNGTGPRGRLTIIARVGRTISRDNLASTSSWGGRYNSVDGPALDWLATMPMPRIWISDGECNGNGTQTHAQLAAIAQAKVKRGHITQVLNVDAAIAALTRLRR